MLVLGVKLYEKRTGVISSPEVEVAKVSQVVREDWRMPPMDTLAPARLTLSSRMWMLVLRGYLVIAAGLLIVKLVVLAVG